MVIEHFFPQSRCPTNVKKVQFCPNGFTCFYMYAWWSLNTFFPNHVVQQMSKKYNFVRKTHQTQGLVIAFCLMIFQIFTRLTLLCRFFRFQSSQKKSVIHFSSTHSISIVDISYQTIEEEMEVAPSSRTSMVVVVGSYSVEVLDLRFHLLKQRKGRSL